MFERFWQAYPRGEDRQGAVREWDKLNSDTRKLSSADQNRQAERLEDLLRQLQDEGVEFPGRLRDWVANLSGMSRSKLARLKVIRDRLDPYLAKAYYAKGKMNEATAYKLAQFPPDVQRQIILVYTKSRDIRYLYEHTAVEIGKDITRMKKLTCPPWSPAALAAAAVASPLAPHVMRFISAPLSNPLLTVHAPCLAA